MAVMSVHALDRAGHFVKTHARAVDRTLFEHHFEQAPAQAVWDALAGFQNADGGFGRALEPDFRLADSSALATSVAFQYLMATGAGPDCPLVRGAVDYLIDTLDREHLGWLATPPEVNDYPRAPWWNYDAAQAAERLRTTWANPSAELVGCLHAFRSLVEPALLEQLAAKAMAMLDRVDDTCEGHDLLTYVRLLEQLPEPEKSRAVERVTAVLPTAVALRPEQWAGYSVRPLWAAPSPSSPLADALAGPVALQLDFEIEQQQPDGSWHPFWAWGQYESDWEQAKVEWQGHLTVKTLTALRDYGRLADR